MKAIISAHIGWANRLREAGIFVDGNGIYSEGKLVEKVNGEIVVSTLRDVHEGVGGYYIIQAENMQAAIEIAKGCPTFDHDIIEVRQLGV